jgi:hypothetical protein
MLYLHMAFSLEKVNVSRLQLVAVRYYVLLVAISYIYLHLVAVGYSWLQLVAKISLACTIQSQTYFGAVLNWAPI